MKHFTNEGSNNKDKIACYFLVPTMSPKGIVYFAHGVTEYATRNEKLFEHLANEGYIVCANDHMGHGNSKNDHPMYFAGNEHNSGWDCACVDAVACIRRVKSLYGEELPVYGIGFSLGSFIIRTLAIKNPNLFKAIVLIGTGDQSALELEIGKAIAKSEGRKYGMDNFTEKISNLTFETYNKTFEHETKADWLCANKTALNEYLKDAMCGDGFTAGLFYDLLNGMGFTGDKKNIAKMNKDMPILMISGSDDAVGNFTKGVNKLKGKFEKVGLKSEMKFYDGMRHDVLHEVGCKDVYTKIAEFLLRN